LSRRVRRLRVNRREHHQRLQPEVAAARGEFLGALGWRIGSEDRHRLAAVLLVRRAPRDVPVASGLDARERALQRELRPRQRHAGYLELRLALRLGGEGAGEFKRGQRGDAQGEEAAAGNH